MPELVPFLMFEDRLDEAVEFYTSTFPESSVRELTRGEPDGPAVSAEFVVAGQRFMAYAGGPHFHLSDGFSMFLQCADQDEIDLYWGRLLEAGARPVRCGWITDRFGLSWQIIPRCLVEFMRDPDSNRTDAVLRVLLGMVKIDVSALERAYAGT